MTHLEAIQLRLSNERTRLAAAKSPQEIAIRKAWIAQIEREISSELKFSEQSDPTDMSDDELLRALSE